jgi:hypothetical protein
MDRKKSVRKNDMTLLAGLFLVGIVLFILVGFVRTDGARVDVLIDGEVAASYPLREDREIDLGYNGHNLLRIEGGRASVADADCPDKLCVKQRAISKEGETIICLPHRLVVRISGGETSDIDGVVQ